MRKPQATLHSSKSAAAAAAQVQLHFQHALALCQSGNIARAQGLCRQILASSPMHVDTLHLLGLLAVQERAFAQAITLLGKVIKLDPNNAPALLNRGSAYKELGRFDAALASYDRAIALDASLPEAHYNRALVLQELGRIQEAVGAYQRAMSLDPGRAEICVGLGNVLSALREFDSARHCFERALLLDGSLSVAAFGRANALYEEEKLFEALEAYDRTLALQPDHAAAFSNRGNVLRELGRLDAALSSYDRAIALRHDLATTHCNRANVLAELDRFEPARQSYADAIALDPNHAEAHCNLALLQLRAGNFTDGWANFEWRHRRGVPGNRRHVERRWSGTESIAGKTILLRCEQGLGDTIQFCRFAQSVASLQAEVLLEVQPPLLALLAQVQGAARVLEKDAEAEFDVECPLMSLPMALGTQLATIPSPGRYLWGKPEKIAVWESRLGTKAKPRIGLCWSGSKNQRADRRSLPLEELLPHLSPRFQFVSLQRDISASESELLTASGNVLHFDAAQLDFSSTAALCECLDLVITVDTNIAHLSGALGKRTWILLGRNPDWRWLTEREDSPWYPTATLFRQRSSENWRDTLPRVFARLASISGAVAD